jgi:hypothetical protein
MLAACFSTSGMGMRRSETLIDQQGPPISIQAAGDPLFSGEVPQPYPVDQHAVSGFDERLAERAGSFELNLENMSRCATWRLQK